MRSFFGQSSLDVTGFWASAICAVHCVAVPILLSVSAYSGLVFLKHPTVEYSILTVSSLVGIGSLLPSYFRQHRKLKAILFLIAGLLLIGIGQRAHGAVFEVLFTSIGAATVAVSHIINLRLCANCRKC
jgi:hypothetical protein